LRNVEFGTKRDFVGLFEEVAIMLNSGLIREYVALHMFGYYAIDCWDSKKFWEGMEQHSPYCLVFKDFVQRMKAASKKGGFSAKEYRI
jgi:tRNA A37 N6-isopentenylltransferase MiaA